MLGLIKASFKPKPLVYTMIIDSATLILITLFISILVGTLENSAASMNLPEHIFELSEAELMQLSESIGGYYSFFIMSLAIFFVASFAIISLTRVAIWAKIYGKKLNSGYFLKATLFGTAWLIVLGSPAAIILMTFKQEIAEISAVAYLAVLAYFSMVMFMLYAETGKFPWLRGISYGAKRLDMVLAYAVLAAIYFAAYQPLNNLIGMSIMGMISGTTIVIFYFAFSRLLLYEIKKRG